MKPYFQEKDITLYQGDCLEILPKLDLGKRVLLFTDPPYGIGETGKRSRESKSSDKWMAPKQKDYGDKDWDKKPPPPEYFEGVLANTKDQIIFGGNYFTEWLRNSSCWLFWDKNNGKCDFADGELAWTSFSSAVRKYTWLWNGFQKERPEERYHPTQKPVGLAKLILKDYYNKQKYDLVLDTHMGVGSFGVACQELGIPYVGIDMDSDYCRDARFRLANLETLAELTEDKQGFFY